MGSYASQAFSSSKTQTRQHGSDIRFSIRVAIDGGCPYQGAKAGNLHCGSSRTRTDNLVLAKHPLYHWSYEPKLVANPDQQRVCLQPYSILVPSRTPMPTKRAHLESAWSLGESNP